MKRTYLPCTLLAAFLLVSVELIPSNTLKVVNAAQESGQSPDGIWTKISEDSNEIRNLTLIARPTSFSAYNLNQEALQEKLRRAPLEFTPQAASTEIIITLPLPNGNYSRFRIEETQVMDPRLAAKYPSLKSYAGRGLDDPTANASLDSGPSGLRIMIISSTGTIFVSPTRKESPRAYVSYFKTDEAEALEDFRCIVTRRLESLSRSTKRRNLRLKRRTRRMSIMPFAATDNELRTYRLAVAATSRFVAAVHDPNNPTADLKTEAMDSIRTSVNRINRIYVPELGIRFTLVPNNDSIIYTDAGTDPYNNLTTTNVCGVACATRNKNQEKINEVIGSANYDIGHVFTTRVGSGAIPEGACDKNWGAKGVTSSSNPQGESFAVDYFAHEIGHQFGAHHTFNGTINNCSERADKHAYEPGSGTTVMGYSGPSNLCNEETVQTRSDDYFHAESLREINDYITNNGVGYGGSCPTRQSTGNNHQPAVDAGQDFIIPAGTPFTLVAKSGRDDDGDNLTYTWEQFDVGAPLFRSRRSRAPRANACPANAPRPTPDPLMTRTFPILSHILVPPAAGTFTAETLPTSTRTMTFRVTARDQRGRYGFDDMKVKVEAGRMREQIGPFVVRQPEAGITWKRRETKTITWNVARTNIAPINSTHVRIILLIDGDDTADCDETDPIVLIASTPNSGSATVTMPDNAPLTEKARIKIEAVNNIFFNISPGNFHVVASG